MQHLQCNCNLFYNHTTFAVEIWHSINDRNQHAQCICRDRTNFRDTALCRSQVHNILKQFVEIVIKLIVRNEQVMKRKWQNSSPLEVTAMVRMGHWDKRRDINWFQLKYSLCDNMKLQHDRTIFLLFVNGFIDISWWCASRWLMMMLPMVRFIYLVLMMRKVSMSIVLMGLLAPLVVMVSASLLIVENDHRNNFQIQRLPATGDWAPATWLQQHYVFWACIWCWWWEGCVWS